jgi:VanZ family protein
VVVSQRAVRVLFDGAIVAAVILVLAVTLDSYFPRNETAIAVDESPYLLGLLPYLVHMALFGVLGASVGVRIALERRELWRRLVIVAFVAIAMFAAADEQAQRLVAGRGAELLDWVADMVGAGVGVGGALVSWRWWGRPTL